MTWFQELLWWTQAAFYFSIAAILSIIVLAFGLVIAVSFICALFVPPVLLYFLVRSGLGLN